MADRREHRLLTVRQPWARPIVEGHKQVENRSPGFTHAYRGPLWIHAAGSWNVRGLTDRRITGRYGPREALLADETFVRGAVVGRCTVVDIHHAVDGCCRGAWAEQSYTSSTGELVAGATHLVLVDAVRLAAPIPCSGALGLWRASRVAGLAETLDHAR